MLVVAPVGVQAATNVQWVDWTLQPTANMVIGTVAGVTATYAGPRQFAQITGGGTDYWVTSNLPDSYTQGIINRPPGTDIIALNTGGNKSISFSSAVTNVYMALTRWNGNVVTFDQPFSVVTQGEGYWGSGTLTPMNGNTGFTASGEFHGIIRFSGTFTSLNFTDTTGNWHGFTIGIGQVGSAVPEPQSWAMLIAGFGAIGLALRRRTRALA